MAVDLGVDPETNKRIRPAREGATREEVLKAGAECLAQMCKQPGPIHAPRPGTVADWLAEWLRSVADRPGGRGDTYANYERACRNHIVPALGEVVLDALTSDQVRAMLDTKT